MFQEKEVELGMIAILIWGSRGQPVALHPLSGLETRGTSPTVFPGLPKEARRLSGLRHCENECDVQRRCP